MSPLSCYIIGEGSLTIQCADHLIESGHTIRGIVSCEHIVVRWAEENGVAVVEPGRGLHERLKEPFDILFSIVNFSIISDEVLALPKIASINFHDGPLPEYAGLNVTSWAIINREPRHAVSWHLIGSGIDDGDVLESRTIPISADETSYSLNTKCFEAGLATFKQLLQKLAAGNMSGETQDTSRRAYFSRSRRPAQAAVLDWSKRSDELMALIRGLDFGTYDNPLGCPKCLIGDTAFLVEAAEECVVPSGLAPGTVVEAEGNHLVVAASAGGLRLQLDREIGGRSVERLPVKVGDGLRLLDGDEAQRIDRKTKEYASSESYWIKEISRQEPLQIPYDSGKDTEAADYSRSEYLPEGLSSLAEQHGIEHGGELLIALVSLMFAKLSGGQFTLGIKVPLDNPFGLFADTVPWNVSVDVEGQTLEELRTMVNGIVTVSSSGSYVRDVATRFHALRDLKLPTLRVVVDIREDLEEMPSHGSGIALQVSSSLSGDCSVWKYDATSLSAEDVRRMQSHVEMLIAQLLDNPACSIGELTLLTAEERELLLHSWNDTGKTVPSGCVHQLIEEVVDRNPDSTALVHRDQSLTYREMDERANRLAHNLIERGVVTETLVGIFVERSIDMVVSCLAVMKAGAAYVPLDPDFPRDRIRFMLEDAQIGHVITVSGLAGEIPVPVDSVLLVDEVTEGAEPTSRPDAVVEPDNLCYVIYTSGSTGRPKGVQLEHRNVVNFFVGMDDRIEHDQAGVWLAVTSLSFDISVLELFWTLARGFEVVIYDHIGSSPSDATVSSRPMDFSLFFFASGEGGDESADKYRLLLDAARFADAHDFAAVWTPERHFHAFGGLYPNPSVASAAVAAITENIDIRAGSCVSPLHSPIRIAEEWAVVDNLSQGRVGISFAAGWQPDDFVLMPDNFADRKAVMFKQIEEVRELWRGGTVRYVNGKGKEVEVGTLPRPVQDDLPVWITAAGSPETFQMAGEKGYNILTHLLGQSVAELAEKIQVYRQARQASGFDPDTGNVTLMLHTFVGEDNAQVKELVRGPMKEYLKSSIGLIKLAAWSFPTFRQKTTGGNGEFSVQHLSDEEFDEVLDFSFERYFETSGLFGTVDTCVSMVEQLKEVGVKEVSCLIDYGVGTDLIIDQLPRLDEVRRRCNQRGPSTTNASFPDLVERFGVTHFQCTPSMASMLTSDAQGLAALGKIGQIMIGGEAFPASLARRLTSACPTGILNMYGPTETTIWSSTAPVRPDEDVTIGRPIANTSLYVVDQFGQPVPVGVPGELWIGGAGVARGYLGRPELTQERFVPNPHLSDGSRVYRTGDLVRYRHDGTVEFLGRMDYQVKVRGYRIELGEIESVLAANEHVGEAVAMVRGDTADDRRIVAYVIPANSINPSTSDLREYLSSRLPDYMVPTNFVVLDRFPITPNGKVDRKRLPAPMEIVDGSGREIIEPRTPVERDLVETWTEVLQVAELSVTDNFFDLGGNSLIAVNLVAKVRGKFGIDLPLVSLFRSPTVADMSALIADLQIEQASDQDLAKAMSNIDQLSDEEVRALLQKSA